MISELRVLAATIDLNSAVEVGIGDRQQREHNANRLRDVLNRALAILVDHAHRFLVLELVAQELGRDVILEHLVLEHAEVGLLHRDSASSTACSRPATVIAQTIRSTASWSSLRSASAASRARRTHASIRADHPPPAASPGSVIATAIRR
jgi:hypothetical protein